MEQPKIVPEIKSGKESFTLGRQKLDFQLHNFWQWNQSNLIENRTRGILAEYIVKQALDIKSLHRTEWDSYDLTSNTGKKIEIKSAAYIQTWKQSKFSTIRFGIEKTKGSSDSPHFDGQKRRWADYYIFCLFVHKEQSTIDPLNLNQWEFYILDTEILNRRASTQKSIGLNSLLNLNPVKCCFEQIKQVIDGA